MTYEQEYHHEVYEYTSNLIQAVQRLEDVPLYLGRFPNSRTFKKHGINLHKWILYHYSNYLVTVVSAYDTALLLINAIFLLGLDPKNCNDGTVTNNRRVKVTKVKSAIEKLKDVTAKYRNPRNLYVHRGRLPNLEKLDLFEGVLFIHETKENSGNVELLSKLGQTEYFKTRH